jgi:hypothetical protein
MASATIANLHNLTHTTAVGGVAKADATLSTGSIWPRIRWLHMGASSHSNKASIAVSHHIDLLVSGGAQVSP